MVLLPAIAALAFLGAADEPETLLAETDALLEAGEPERAENLLRARLEGGAGSNDAKLWAALGRAARQAADFETAAPAFERARAAGADLSSGVAAAQCRLEMKDGEGATAVLDRCDAGGDPAAAAVLDELRGMALFLRVKESEARPFLERARAAGRAPPAHFLGLVHFHRGEYAEALALFEEAVRAQPDDYYSLLYRAWALLELNRLDDARRALQDARAVASTPEVEDMLGRVELRAERFEEALSRFRAALAASPRYAEAQSGAATALRRLGRAEEAKAAAAAFRKLFQAQQEELKTAYELHQKHLAAPRDASIAEELGRHYLATGDLQEAERYGWKALVLDPDRSSARLLLARALAASGRFRQAALQYRKVLRARPEEVTARTELEDLVRRHARPKS